MLKSLFQKPIIKILAAAVLILTAITLIAALRPQPPIVKAAEPPSGAINLSLKQQVKIFFEKTVVPSEITLRTEPQADFSYNFDSKNTVLTIIPRSSWQANTDYQLNLRFRSQKKPFFTLLFQTIANQTDEALINRLEQNKADNYPLLKYLPAQTDSFILGYQGPRTLYAILLAEDKQKAQEEILQYIQSKGVNPAYHKIIYK